jgi:hypothetical protein
MWCKFIERCHDTKKKKSSRLSPSSLDIVSGCVNHVIWLQTLQFLHLPSWKLFRTIKFIYSKKATKFCKISPLLLSYVVPVKTKVEILQNMSFSEYMNFNISNISSYYNKL